MVLALANFATTVLLLSLREQRHESERSRRALLSRAKKHRTRDTIARLQAATRPRNVFQSGHGKGEDRLFSSAHVGRQEGPAKVTAFVVPSGSKPGLPQFHRCGSANAGTQSCVFLWPCPHGGGLHQTRRATRRPESEAVSFT
jgi:hypothetical protein